MTRRMGAAEPRNRKRDGAIDGARTRDIQDHNLALYQLSYDRRTARWIGPPRRVRQPVPVAVPVAACCRAARRAIQAPIRASASRRTLSFLQKAKRA